ncbi:MAG: hypothetical protein EON59_07585 [Alphaproteobacteria bacterium]|nr:MAG: hypothetical protein EON59_07585 [Alphaproteobacteria bacterium]
MEINLGTSDEVYGQAKALELAGRWKQTFRVLQGADAPTPAQAFASAKARTLADIARLPSPTVGPFDDAPPDDQRGIYYDLALQKVLDRLGYASATEIKPGDLTAAEEAELAGTKAAVEGSSATPSDYRKPLSELAAAFLADRQRPGSDRQLKGQTVGQYEATYRLYRDHTGDAPLAKSDRRSVREFFDKLKKLHAFWGRSPETKTRTLDQLLAISAEIEGPRLSDKTLFRYMTTLGQLWDWARDGGEVSGDSPFKRQVRKGKQESDQNDPWTKEALLTLLQGRPDESEPGNPDPFYWIPRICLLSGMRPDEVCSLEAVDLRTAEGIRYFDITAAKTSAGVRVVPVHSALMPFLRVTPKSGYLFPHLTPGGPDQKRWWNIGKVIGRRIRKIEGATTFYGLRKNVIEAFERNRMLDTEIAQLVGHGKKGITYRVYSPNGLRIDQKRDLIERMVWIGSRP